MRVRRLFLKAFGPFTDTVLEFPQGPGIHLIHGPNEAGKSSALRALGDLRFGIPAQSPDDFVHDRRALWLSAVFEDSQGRLHALGRRKGNKDTLMYADPESGVARPGAAVSAALIESLTGGLDRRQFETRHGLDSARLREGGSQLIRADGELGATLFEASSGASGVRSVLAALQEEARDYHAPRSQSAQLNVAQKQLDVARQTLRQTVTRPDEWKARQRNHEDAIEGLRSIREQLDGLRARERVLSELRAVEPLLRALERGEQEWAATVCHHVLLEEDAPQRRATALVQQARSREALAEADQELAACAEAMAKVRIDTSLLREEPLIARLRDELAGLRSQQERYRKLAERAAAGARTLAGQAGRWLGRTLSYEQVELLFLTLPTGAEQGQLQRLVDEANKAADAHAQAAAQLAAAEARLAALHADAPAEPDDLSLPLLSEALDQAQALGDIGARQADLSAQRTRAVDVLSGQFRDLGLTGADQLRATRQVALSDIEHRERERRALEGQIEQLSGLCQDLARERVQWQARRDALLAIGEVVNAQTLAAARARRDQAWAQLRAALLTEAPREPAARLAAVAAFEAALSEADRQADLLRVDAARVAELSHCDQRIAEIDGEFARNGEQLAEQRQRHLERGHDWLQVLALQQIPAISIEAARDWMVLRAQALETLQRISDLDAELLRGSEDIAHARARIAAILPSGPGAGDVPLADLMARARAQQQLWIRSAAAGQAHRAALATLTTAVADVRRECLEQEARCIRLRQELTAACPRLFLPGQATTETLQVRLVELAAWGEDFRRHGEDTIEVGALARAQQAFDSAVQGLAARLGEAVDGESGDFVDRLARRLLESTAAARQRESLERQSAEASRRRQRAAEALAAAGGELDRLRAAAGVNTVPELETAERLSIRRRTLESELERLREQLSEASQRAVSELRADLEGQDAGALDHARRRCADEIAALEARELDAITREQQARSALAAIDTSDAAVQARADLEAAVARYRAGLRPWATLRLAEVLLTEAMRRHREQAQGPVLARAGDYFRQMTAGRFVRLVVDSDQEQPMLLARTAGGKEIGLAALSEGTADQLYLSLRLAALDVQRRPDRMLPLVLDDVLMTADDGRAACMFQALASFSAHTQVLVFTHHQHLIEVARSALPAKLLAVQTLMPAFAPASAGADS